jgi:hypothetical protein
LALLQRLSTRETPSTSAKILAATQFRKTVIAILEGFPVRRRIPAMHPFSCRDANAWKCRMATSILERRLNELPENASMPLNTGRTDQ